MRSDDLKRHYRQLRDALEVASSRHPWEAANVDRIAHDLLCLERALAKIEYQSGRRRAASGSPESLPMPGAAM